jgi:NTE family protein
MSSGYLTGEKILRYIDALSLTVPYPVDFDDLPRRYRAVATDIATGDRVVLSGGSIAEAMRASMSLPAIFAPYHLNGRYLVDGCMVDNLPVDLAREMGADIIIAVDPFDGNLYDPVLDNRTPFSALSRSFDILVRVSVKQQLAKADVAISVDMKGYTTSDYLKAGEIIKLGEECARASSEELKAVALRVGSMSGAVGVPAPGIAAVPPVTKIIVEGASAQRSAEVRKLCSGIIGTVPDIAVMQELLRNIDSSGLRETIRLHRDFIDPELPLVIKFTGEEPVKSALRLSFAFVTTLSSSVTSDLDLIPAISLRGLTTKDSRLLIDAELIDAPGFDIRFIQPVVKEFYVSPYATYTQDFSTGSASREIEYRFRNFSQTFGLRAVVQPMYGVEASAGWSYELIENASDDSVSLSVLRAGIRINRIDSAIFPVSGIMSSFEGMLSLRELGSDRTFATFATHGSNFFSFGTPLSVGYLWKTGSVIGAASDDEGYVPSFYKPDITGRRLFLGPLDADDRVGSFVAGFAVEVKYNVNKFTPGISFPVFLIANGAIGTVLHEAPRINEAVDAAIDSMIWNSTLGAGIRISDSFGVSVRGGVLGGADLGLVPFVTIDAGAIGYK